MEVVPGTELSAHVRDREVHILAYCINCSDDQLGNSLRQSFASRHERVVAIVEKLKVLGLSVSLDRDELERLENLNLPRPDKWIIKSRFGNGSRMYNIADPDNSIFMVRPDLHRLIAMSYVAPIETEYWDNDGSAEYRAIFERIEREGIVLERS